MNVFAASADMPVSWETRCSASVLSCGVGLGLGESIRSPCNRPVQANLPSGSPRTVADVAAMTMCPKCGSSFLQPLRCEAKGSDVVLVELRCSECMTWLKAPHTRADMRELDRLQAEFRALITTQYERYVAESMEALAACLGQALELDLVSADDFAPRGKRALRA